MIFGPESVVVEGPVPVIQKNGRTSVADVLGVGKSFLVDGVAHRYGYLEPKAEAPAQVAAAAPSPASDLDFMPDDFIPGNDVADPADWG